MAEWRPGPKGNLVLDGDGFYVSYNPDTSDLESLSDNLIASLLFGNVSLVGDYGGCDETALCCNESGEYYVLNGDFREEFEAVIDNGYASCFCLYEALAEKHKSSWSSDTE